MGLGMGSLDHHDAEDLRVYLKIMNMDNRFNLITLRPIGRSGSFFIQNLFDSHPAVISFPFPFPFYYHWYFFHKIEKDADVEKLLVYFLDNTCLRYMNEGASSELSYIYSYKDDNGNSREYKIDMVDFRNHLEQEIKQISIYPSRRQFLIALHIAYARTIGLELKDRNFIFLHEHYAYLFNEAMEDFPDARNIVTVRDPRNSFASYIKKNKIDHGALSPLYDLVDLNYTVKIYLNALHFKKKFPDSIYFISTEKMNAEPEIEIKKLAEWAGLHYTASLLKPTFAGNRIDGISVFNKSQSGFDQSGLLKDHWKKVCSWREIRLLDAIFSELYVRFDYPPGAGPLPAWNLFVLTLNPDIKIFLTRYRKFSARALYIFAGCFAWSRVNYIRNYFAIRKFESFDPPVHWMMAMGKASRIMKNLIKTLNGKTNLGYRPGRER